MNHPSRLHAVVFAAILFGVPATASFAAQADSATTSVPLMLIAADDTRGEGTTRSAKTTAKDAAITAKVKTRLLADDNVKGMKIDVDTYNGVVILSGTTETPAQMAQAASLAAKVKGVSSVTNKLTLSMADTTDKIGALAPGDNTTRSAETTARDAAITAKVKTKLLADPDVAGMKIDVDTRNSVVMLSGTAATEAQMARALELASGVEGVTSVANHLTLPGAKLDLHPDGAHHGSHHSDGHHSEVHATESSRSAGTTIKDAAITTSVKTKLLADPDVSGLKIDVDTRNHVVMLSGTVASQAQITEAVHIASHVDGVTSVDNHLKVAK